LSQHVGGMVITHEPLCELVPIENAAMPERTVIQWDKDDLDALGILKVDCLALGMLTAIHKCFDLIRRHTGSDYTLATVPTEDPAVYDMVSRADTVGIFQIESRAQMSMLPRLRPQCFYDLVIEVAIVRPGPIQGNMVHPYLRRRNGEELVEYPGEAVREVLQKTLGVPIFQEQAMRLAVVAAGFTPGEADQLRRAMGAWRKRGIIDRFQNKLTDGMLANGYTLDFAERLFQQIRGFGEYGFPESHAASFALLVYVSSWLKRYHPAAFAAALLNSQPMGFYAPAQLVADARKHDVEVLPIDVNASDWDYTLEPRGDRLALRLGMRQVKGLSHAHVARILAARGEGSFTSLDDLAARTQLGNSVLTRLARADLFGSITLNRRDATWDALPPREQHPLFDDSPEAEPTAPLPEMSALSEVIADYRTAGLSLRAHPVSFLRAQLDDRRVVCSEQLATLPPDRRYSVAGIVLLRQRPSTASGITFVTLEDETGTANLIIRPDVWERHHHVARRASAILAHGTLQRQNETIHLLVDRLEDLTASLADGQFQSRDFH
ncbi:MAG: error-prone DNA polymerase, partial [Planctomycetaceae bacterium]|nr:error-prone DNA polymerase [Planctomycetaceae bacterium]